MLTCIFQEVFIGLVPFFIKRFANMKRSSYLDMLSLVIVIYKFTIFRKSRVMKGLLWSFVPSLTLLFLSELLNLLPRSSLVTFP